MSRPIAEEDSYILTEEIGFGSVGPFKNLHQLCLKFYISENFLLW